MRAGERVSHLCVFERQLHAMSVERLHVLCKSEMSAKHELKLTEANHTAEAAARLVAV